MPSRLLLALGVLLCAAAFVPAAAAAAPPGSISGTVTAADTGQGIGGLEVCARSLEFHEEEDEFEEFWGCEYTNPDGSYEIPTLAAAEYEVEFWAKTTGYVTEYYPGAVLVGDGPVTGIDAVLDRAATLEGKVTRSSDGAPVEQIEVCAWAIESEDFGGCSWTEADGSYSLEDLGPGEWGVEFWPRWSGQNLALQFYDGRDRWSEADPVSVQAGETVTGIDAEMYAGAAISGNVSAAATGSALGEIVVCSVYADQIWTCTETEPNGDYELPYLAPGQYKVVFSIDFADWYGEGPEEEGDGFATQFWDHQASLATADAISLSTGQIATGVDASLAVPGAPPSPPSPTVPGSTPAPILMPPPTVGASVAPPSPPPSSPASQPKKPCRKGLKRKKIKGTWRCVKQRKHRRHRHGSASSSKAPALASLPFLGRTAPATRPLFRISR